MTTFFLHWKPQYVDRVFFSTLEDAQTALIFTMNMYIPSVTPEIREIPKKTRYRILPMSVNVWKYESVWNCDEDDYRMTWVKSYKQFKGFKGSPTK